MYVGPTPPPCVILTNVHKTVLDPRFCLGLKSALKLITATIHWTSSLATNLTFQWPQSNHFPFFFP